MSAPRGLYTPVYESLLRHLKTVRASADLRTDRHKLVGHMIAMWTWCLAGLPDPETPLTAAEVAAAAEWPARDAGRFAEALVAAGFLEQEGDCYLVHEWGEYGGKVASRQRYDRQRKRGSSEEPPRGEPGSSSELPGSFQGDSRTDETRREETRRETERARDADPILGELHAAVFELLGGTDAPLEDWCGDLIGRGLERSDIDYAVQEARRKGKRSMPYVRAILENRIDERKAGRIAPERPPAALDQPERANVPSYDIGGNGLAAS